MLIDRMATIVSSDSIVRIGEVTRVEGDNAQKGGKRFRGHNVLRRRRQKMEIHLLFPWVGILWVVRARSHGLAVHPQQKTRA